MLLSASFATVAAGLVHTPDIIVSDITASSITASGELSAATVTGFITGDGNNRVLTSNGDGTLTAEDGLTFNSSAATFALQTQNIDMTAAGVGLT